MQYLQAGPRLEFGFFALKLMCLKLLRDAVSDKDALVDRRRGVASSIECWQRYSCEMVKIERRWIWYDRKTARKSRDTLKDESSLMFAEQPYKKLSTVNTCPVHFTLIPIERVSGLSLVWRNRKAEPAAAKQSPIVALFRPIGCVEAQALFNHRPLTSTDEDVSESDPSCIKSPKETIEAVFCSGATLQESMRNKIQGSVYLRWRSTWRNRCSTLVSNGLNSYAIVISRHVYLLRNAYEVQSKLHSCNYIKDKEHLPESALPNAAMHPTFDTQCLLLSSDIVHHHSPLHQRYPPSLGRLNPKPGTAGGVATATGSGLTYP